jgi:hypothetical protein
VVEEPQHHHFTNEAEGQQTDDWLIGSLVLLKYDWASGQWKSDSSLATENHSGNYMVSRIVGCQFPSYAFDMKVALYLTHHSGRRRSL